MLQWTTLMLNKYISQENQVILIKRLKSLVWASAYVGLVGLVNLLAQNLNMFSLPPEMTVVLGLLLKEVSHFLSSQAPTQS